MLSKFINKKLNKAKFKKLKDGTYFGEVAGVKGVWANAKTKKACKDELREVLEEWVLLKVRDHERIPGLDLRLGHRSSLGRVSKYA